MAILSAPPVLNGRTNAPNGGLGTDSALADADNRPSVPSQSLRNPGIPAFVRIDLFAPEFLIAAREVLARTSVPEASVDEYGDFESGPCEIRAAGYRPLLAISTKAGCPENPAESKFGRSVVFRTDRGHDPGSDIAWNVVHRSFPFRLTIQPAFA